MGADSPEADLTVSVRGRKAFLHAVNTRADVSVPLDVSLEGGTEIRRFTVHEIAPEDPTLEITPQRTDCFDAKTRSVEGSRYLLPPAGVAVLEFDF